MSKIKTNNISYNSNRQVHLERAQALVGSDRSHDTAIRRDEVTPRTALLSSLIAQNKIAREFARMDGAAEALVQDSLQNSSPGPDTDEVASPREYEGTTQGERLKDIVYDDAKWNFFVRSVSLKDPHSEVVKNTRMGLIKGFESGDWSQAENDPLFNELMRKQIPESRNTQDVDGADKRIDLWLEDSNFFKQLFTAVQDGDLFSRPNLITDSLLIDFVLSLPDDSE